MGCGWRSSRRCVIVGAQLATMDHWLEPVSTGVLAAGTIGAARYMALRTRSAARERELLAEAAATEERLRIARELHDAVGHDVALMVVQAEALAAVTGDERADAIATLGRHTMGELHRTLKVLRDEAALAPAAEPRRPRRRCSTAPARPACRSRSRSRARRGRCRRALDASAYRIVQEAVTNVIRHAHGAPAPDHRALRRGRARAGRRRRGRRRGERAATAATASSACASASRRSAARSRRARASTASPVRARDSRTHDPRPHRRRPAADAHRLQDRARGDRADRGRRRGRRRAARRSSRPSSTGRT